MILLLQQHLLTWMPQLSCHVRSLSLVSILLLIPLILHPICSHPIFWERNITILLVVYQKVLQNYKNLQDIIDIKGMDELSEDDKLTVACSRKIQRFLSQPFHIDEVFTGAPGKYVELKESITSFQVQVPKLTYGNCPKKMVVHGGCKR